MDLPQEAQVVIIGGGVIGCSIAYHLARSGTSDVVLLERRQLTCGTTWHAAGLISELRDSRNATNLARYSAELYRSLEAETGQATGCKFNGSLSTAVNHERMEELTRRADMAKAFGIDVEVLGPGGLQDHYPLLNVSDLVGGIFIPGDGQGDPVGITQALARGARQNRAEIFEHTQVEQVLTDARGVIGVRTDRGTIRSTKVVLATGMWTHQLAAQLNVNVPLHACEHFYVVTEPFSAITAEQPVYRDFDGCAYYKEDAGKLLIGAFEPVAKPWGENIPVDFCFDELPYDIEHFAPILEGAMHRIPALANVGIQTFFCGPESFTPDDRYHLGRVPEIGGLFVAAGMNSIGILSAGGVGRVMADWITDGHAPADFADVDIRRNATFTRNRRYLRERVSETLGLLYAVHWPYYQYRTSRDIRQSPLHGRLADKGACFGELAGWERANWFAPEGVTPTYQYSFKRQNWFQHSADEHHHVRSRVGVFDQSSFAKFRVQGRDALACLNHICANDVAVDIGRLVYTQWLNERGGIEADVTVTRTGEEDFLIVTSALSQVRDFDWLTQHIPDNAHCFATDVTSAYAVLGVMGPHSRSLLQTLTDTNLSNQSFAFATSQEIDLAMARVRASRITYVGELGWELYIPTEFSCHVFDALFEQGEAFDLRPIGYHALNSLRIEKAYRHWGHDITEEDTPVEAGLSFAVDTSKGDFIGRDAFLRQQESGANKRLVQFLLTDPEPLLYHNETIYRDGEMVGYVASGMYGHTLGGAVGLGYVHRDSAINARYVREGNYEIEVAGVRYPAQASLTAMYDRHNEKIRC